MTYTGALPQAYVLKSNSLTSYGQLAYIGSDSKLASIAIAADSTLIQGKYANAITGITAIDGQLRGQVGEFRWKLKNTASGTWDFFAWLYPDTVNTLAELGYGRDEILNALRNRASVTADALANDCADFSAGSICLSASLRYTNFGRADEVAGVVNAALRIAPGLRVGAFLDYSVDRISHTVRLKQQENLPMYGGFIGYAPRADGLGLQIRLSGAYSTEAVTISRSDALDITEAGSGTSRLKSWAIGGEAGYAFRLGRSLRLLPYVGLRHSYDGRAGYAERATADVEFPVTYETYSQRLTTGQAGLQVSGVIDRVMGYRLGAGLEYDLAAQAGSYAGSTAIPVLQTFAVANGASPHRLRAQGVAEVDFAIAPAVRVSLGASIRQETYTDHTPTSITARLRFGF
ncbi:MAG: hypothetical protein RL519_1945 [Pseudomonadota bacterium]